MLLASHSRRVLIVDDYPDTAETGKIILSLSGHEVTTAYDGKSAFEIAQRNIPDVIFSDLLLPQLNGLELARKLRSDVAFNKTVLFAMTGLSTMEVVEKAAESGFDYFAKKPVDDNILERESSLPVKSP
jgi:CheY-like chemotaxis protein